VDRAAREINAWGGDRERAPMSLVVHVSAATDAAGSAIGAMASTAASPLAVAVPAFSINDLATIQRILPADLSRPADV